MKARVKKTNENIEVVRYCSTIRGDLFECLSTGKRYFYDELAFGVEDDEPKSGKVRSFTMYKPQYDPDYWTRLEHQYAGMAMQGILTNPIGFENIRVRGTNIQIETALLASEFAHALVEKLKEMEVRK